jgi:hypothetical protein
MKTLEPLVGEWAMRATFEGAPPSDAPARVTFDFLHGGRFLIQRWAIDLPDAPPEVPTHGIAIIGPDSRRPGGFLQHYFDSRGVARVYKMTLNGVVWTLLRDEPDVSPLDFAQRFSGTFSDDGKTITGAWELCNDGKTWEHDFDLTYSRLT